MASFYYRTNQSAFEAAFGGLDAHQAAELILGHRPLSAAQAEALRLAEGNGGFGLRFDPEPVGHIAFAPVDTRGTGNAGGHVLVPATAECRRAVNRVRREAFAALLGAPRPVADRVFSAARGYAPVLKAALDLWPLFSECPNISNRALREAGFRPRHPNEGAAIAAIRAALRVAA